MAVRNWMRRATATVLMAGVLVTSTARVSTAQDVGAAKRDVVHSDDFRVRVTAALLLGRTRPAGAREVLEKALTDSHPAVRTAAAAALASLGDGAAIPALEHQLSRESSAGAKAQMRTTIEALKHGHSLASRAKVVVVFGTMKNQSGVRGHELEAVLAQAVKSHARGLPGVALAESSDSAVARQAAEQHIPVLVLDGLLNGLTQARDGDKVQFRASVEFVMKKEQDLKGRLTGAATAFGSASSLRDPKIISRLQDDAVDGAVQSAMRGAGAGLTLAAK